METWRHVWRDAIVPQLSTPALEALRTALASDDARLIQGGTTTPPPLMCVKDWPVEDACVLGFCGWQGEGLKTVGEVGEYFARLCFEVDQRLGEPAACRWFLNWFDETPRDEMRQQLLAEVLRAIAERRREVTDDRSDDAGAATLPGDSQGRGPARVADTGGVEHAPAIGRADAGTGSVDTQ